MKCAGQAFVPGLFSFSDILLERLPAVSMPFALRFPKITFVWYILEKINVSVVIIKIITTETNVFHVKLPHKRNTRDRKIRHFALSGNALFVCGELKMFLLAEKTPTIRGATFSPIERSFHGLLC